MINIKKRLLLLFSLLVVITINSSLAQEGYNETNNSVIYDPAILEAFENQTWLPVVVRLVDSSGINITGTKEERRELVRQRQEWFKIKQNEVLLNLSNDFTLEGQTSGLWGQLNKNGFAKLVHNPSIKSISLTSNINGGYASSFDPSILKVFTNQTWVRISIRLVDNSHIIINGTKEEKRELLRQRDEWFKENTQEFLSNLSDDNIHILSNISDGFVAMVTKEGFDELVNNRQVMSVNLDIIGSISLDDSTPLINSDEVWSLGYTGSGIKVCVIDSGVNASHPDLTGKINSEYCYCDITNLGGGGCCLDLTDEDANARDDMGHGTHVVGIISSQDSTFKGVSYDASLYVVKVTNSSGNYYMSDLGKAIDKCRSWGVDVISISLADNLNHPGNSPCPTTIDSDINEAYSADISVVIASGNNAYTTGISYPACSPNAISVGATTKSDAMAYFTNRKFGLLDLLAPGQSIVSLRWDKQRTMPGCTAYGNDFMICSGTSQAAPHEI